MIMIVIEKRNIFIKSSITIVYMLRQFYDCRDERNMFKVQDTGDCPTFWN